MSFGAVTRIPKGLHHLEPVAKNKFTLRYPSRSPHPSTAYVQPKDRIARWNVVPGDKVRLMVGKPKDKFLDEAKGAAGGYKVYTVHSVDMTRNRVYLNGLTNKKANPIRPLPANIDDLPEEEQRQWKEQRNWIDSRRAVQYSNVQLCVEDKGPESVFASRVATSTPFFNTHTMRWQWTRYAVNLTGEAANVEVDPERGQVVIPWPKIEPRKATPPTPIDTLEKDVAEPTLALGPIPTIPSSLIPSSMRAPPPADQAWANAYIFQPDARPDQSMQAAMPLYLGEELGPRFARAKKAKGWKERREMEAIAREEDIKAAVDAWEANGRDNGLEDILASGVVNLEGVTLRPRTRKEIREAAAAQFDYDLAAAKSEGKHAIAAGKKYDYVNHKYVEGNKGLMAIRKRLRKQRKQRKIIERLERLTLSPAKNQVVPEDVRAN